MTSSLSPFRWTGVAYEISLKQDTLSLYSKKKSLMEVMSFMSENVVFVLIFFWSESLSKQMNCVYLNCFV